MSKIQDLLAAQRSKQNGSTPQSVLQSKPAETAKQVEAQRPLTIQEKLAKKSRGNAENISGSLPNSVVEQGSLENGKISRLQSNEFVEPKNETKLEDENAIQERSVSAGLGQVSNGLETVPQSSQEIMPPGLSLLQQMKWKKEHARTSSVMDNALATEISKASKEAQTSPSAIALQSSAALGDNQPQSASQSADAQKTNDGLANIEELRTNLLYLANNIENKDIVSGVIRTIGLQLKNSPELTPHMTNADVNLVVRGARSAYQLAAMAKQSKEDNEKGRSKQLGEVDLIFKDAGIDFSALNFKG